VSPEPRGGDTLDRSRRWRALLDLLAERGRLSVTEVAAQLGVSEATVRRDFTELARQQLVTRTHGGVVATSVAYDLPARYRAASGDSPKERIAAAAVDLVEVGTVVGFNGGTTTSAVARRLASRSDLAGGLGRGQSRPTLTVVTNALNIATELVLRPHIRTVTLGGVARPQSYELTGPLATLVLAELWLDLLVLGVDGVSAAGGASCDHEGEAGVNAMMVQRADTVVVVATGDKLGRRTFARICDAARLAMVVTDPSAPPAEVEALRAAGVDVRIV
jgi:DeoR family transcriptional regulator of aga operon